jgi:hypothetical protein
LIQVVDERKKNGRPQKTTPSDVVSGPTSTHTAEVVGTSPRKVERARTIIDHAPEPIKEAVLNGTTTIYTSPLENASR